MESKPAVLVTDGNQRAALAVVRSLGAAGFPVHVCADSLTSLAGSSRHCVASHGVPTPLGEPDGSARAVDRIAHDHGIRVVIPVSEASLLSLLPRRERLAPAVLPFPSFDRFEAVRHKVRVLERAKGLGIPVPRQEIILEPGRVEPGPLRDLGFPLVLKPSTSVGGSPEARQKLSVTYVRDEEALGPMLESVPPTAYPLIVQERITGPGVGVFLLIWDGELLARFAHRRLREKPPTGGVSVLRESIRPPADFFQMARALLEEFEWEGVAMVEFKVEEKTGTPYLMEVNPRFWGSLQLAVDSGVNFPLILAEATLGMDAEPELSYTVGTKSRWFWGDVDHYLARFKSGDVEAVSRGRARILYEVLSNFIPHSSGALNLEVFRWEDPKPFIRESVDWIRATVDSIRA